MVQRKETSQCKHRVQEFAHKLKLERHPELMERFEAIFALAENEQISTVDQIEELLIEEVRKLGGETICSWVQGQQEKLERELREREPKVQVREKKAAVLHHLRKSYGKRNSLVHASVQLLPPSSQANQGNAVGAFQAG